VKTREGDVLPLSEFSSVSIVEDYERSESLEYM
jgi:hypothetical protein